MTQKIKISTDKSLLDQELIFAFLSNSYWASNRSKEEVEKSIKNSLCFGVYIRGEQIGFARVITDQTTFGYIADVFILPDFSGLGYAKHLMQTILSHPILISVNKWYLITKDAQQLYKKIGFVAFDDSEKTIMHFKPQ